MPRNAAKTILPAILTGVASSVLALLPLSAFVNLPLAVSTALAAGAAVSTYVYAQRKIEAARVLQPVYAKPRRAHRQ